MQNTVIVICAALAMSGCNSATNLTQGAAEYTISAKGAPVVSDEQTYDSLGDRTFTKTQVYRIKLQNNQDDRFHLLVAKIDKKIGDKIQESQEAVALPIVDGIHDFECAHYYDIKLSKSIEEVDNPTCVIEPIGVIEPSRDAKISQS